jgi:hypothetical protein
LTKFAEGRHGEEEGLATLLLDAVQSKSEVKGYMAALVKL